MLLLALFAPWAANAQTTTVTVGTGTTSGYYAPIYTATTDYSYTQQLYTANEIGISGEFTSIGFEYTGPETKSFYVEIYMKHTNASDLTTQIGMSDAVLVYEGWYSVNGPGWVTVPLDQSFYYNGTSNLLIGVNKTAGDGYYNKAMWRCTSIQNMSRLAASDYPITSIDDYSGNMPINNYRPNVQLGMGPYIGTQVTVGTGTTSSYLAPIYSITNYSYTQQLYTAEEIGISGEIRGVGFEFTGTETKNFYVEIYMKPTNASDLSTQIDMTDAVLVYEGWYSVDGPGWVIVPFDQYYYHDGTKNLLIGVNRTSNEGVYNKAMWRCTPIQNMSRVAATDYPVSIDNYSGNMPINNYRPNVLLGIVPEPQVCEKPTGLHLESLYEDGFSIRWTLPDDSGIEVAYNIELNGVVVEEAYNDDYWDTWNTDVEPGTTYTVRIQRACTNYDVSEWSDPLTFTTPATTVTVGTGETTAVYAPIYTMTSYSYTQQLYTAEEIGMEGEIRSLFFDYDGETKSIDIEVYMKSVDASDLTEQIDMTDAVLVFDGTIFPINGWSPIAFDNSFYYDGTKNLLIGVNRTGGDVYDYGKWRFTYMPNMTRLAASDYPISIGNYSGNMPLNNARPNIQIGFIGSNFICPKPSNFRYYLNDFFQVAASWQMEYNSYNIEVNGVVTENVNSPYYFYTEPNTTYTMRVQTVCAPGIVSDWTDPITFTTEGICPAPYNLQVEISPDNPTEATLSWSYDDPTGFFSPPQICINGDMDNLITEAQGSPYTLFNLTLGTSYTVKVRHACGYVNSDWSEEVSFTTPGNNIMIGDPTGVVQSSIAPIASNYSCSVTYMRYSWNEIGEAGAIQNIAFHHASSEAKTFPIKVYMKHLNANSSFPLSSGTLNELDGESPQLVFDGSYFVDGEGWFPINLSTPFLYNGSSNLLIIVLKGETTSYSDSYWWCNQYNYGLVGYYTAGAPFTINTEMDLYSLDRRPDLQIGIIDANLICPVPTGFNLSYPDDNTIVAGWNMDYGSYNIEVNGEVTEYINCPYVIYTEPNTTYTVRVQTVCSPGILSDWTEPIIYTTPAVTEWLTVNDSTATNSYTPIWGLWTDSYAKSQFIIPAADLADMTYGIINKLTFYSSNASINWGDAEFEVYMTEVDYTSFSSTSLIDWTNMTKVMNSGSLSINDNIMEFDFDNPYQYLGGNLMIGFCQTVSGTYGSCNWYGVTQTENTAIGGYENAKAISFQKFLPKTKFDFVMGEAPSCLKPNNLTINYNGGTEATLSWEGNANIYNIDVNGNVIEGIVGTTYSLTELELATIYNVKVQAICDENDLSDWTFPVSFYTDLCVSGEQCEITFQLTDSYGDGWSGNAIKVVDAATGIEIATMANEDLDGTTQVAETQTYTLPVCNGREIQFVWVPGSYANEASYTVLDANGEEIFSGSGALSEPVNYTVDCSCPVPANFDLWYNQNIMASLTWDLGANAYNIEVNGEVTEGIAYAQTSNTTANYILNDLEAHTTYTVRLQAVCENGNSSEWTDPVTFTTTCEEYNVCGFNFEFICNSSAGFQDGYLEIIDVETGEQLWRLDTWDEGEEPLPWSLPEEFFVCTGREVQFVWWGPKTSDYTYALHDAGGEELASGYLSDLPFNHTANCEYVCETPTELTIIDYELHYNQSDVATLSWTGWATYYNISVNGEVIDTADDNQYTLSELEYNTTYEVRVQSVCYDTFTSEWSDPLVFTTLCDRSDDDGLCELNYSLIDENNNGFENGVIEIIDVQTNAVVWHFIASDDFENVPYNQLDNEFFMCPGHEFRIVWDGPVGEGYRFVLYEPGGDDIATCPLSDLLIDMPPVTYTPNCEEQIITQDVTMPAGTNWYTFEVNITLEDLQNALVEAMTNAGFTAYTPDNTITIKTKDASCYYTGTRWRGTLTTLDPTQMYIISLPVDGEVTLQGSQISDDGQPIIISEGANWIVYPFSEPMSVSDAFAGFAVQGDVIKDKDLTAFYNGSRWRGNLTTLEPGKCYIYTSSVASDRPFNFPTSTK